MLIIFLKKKGEARLAKRNRKNTLATSCATGKKKKKEEATGKRHKKRHTNTELHLVNLFLKMSAILQLLYMCPGVDKERQVSHRQRKKL